MTAEEVKSALDQKETGTIFEGICKDCLNEEDTSNGIKGFKN